MGNCGIGRKMSAEDRNVRWCLTSIRSPQTKYPTAVGCYVTRIFCADQLAIPCRYFEFTYLSRLAGESRSFTGNLGPVLLSTSCFPSSYLVPSYLLFHAFSGFINLLDATEESYDQDPPFSIYSIPKDLPSSPYV